MAARGHYRGHRITYDPNSRLWLFSDTGEPVNENRDINCFHCKLPRTAEGHDGCLGTLTGVLNACCGHGYTDSAYIQFADRPTIRGQQALEFFDSVLGE